MPTDFLKRSFLVWGAAVVLGLWLGWGKAATIEVEEDDDELASPATPVPAVQPSKVKNPTNATAASSKEKPVPPSVRAGSSKVKSPSASGPSLPAVSSSHESVKTAVSGEESVMPRVRISDKMGFYYLLESGFVVREREQLSSIGKVMGSFDDQETYNTPHKTYIRITAKDVSLKAGDLLVISRVSQVVRESRSGFYGYWVQNLGVVKVIETDNQRCQVEVVESFFPIEAGDWVRPYDDEVQRWKQAQTKKNLPNHGIQCFVAGGMPGNETADKSDWIVLTAGAKRGVVEGQQFQLRRRVETSDQTVHRFLGKAQAFYVGPDYSMAEIIFNQEPIENGFEAIYQP